MRKAKRRSNRGSILPRRLSELEKSPHFVLRSGRKTVSKNGEWCDAFDPQNHLTISVARKISRRRKFTLCYVLTRQDPFFLVVLKSTMKNGQLTPYVRQTLAYFDGACITYMPGNRIHIFGRGATQFDHPERFDELGMEFYTEDYIISFPDIAARERAGQWL